MSLADAAGLLQAWEDASPLPMQERALRLAAAAHGDTNLDEVMHWTVLSQALKDPLPAKALSFGA